MKDAAGTALRGVVDSHGRHALGDPVALRAALGSVRTDLTETEVGTLVAVAGSGAVERLRSAARRRAEPADAIADAVQVVQATTDLPAADAEQAVRSFAEVLAALPVEPAAGLAQQYRIDWDDTDQDGTHRVESVELPGRARRPLPLLPMGPAAALVLGGVVVLAVALVAPLVRGVAAADRPVPDRHAVEQVAQRYRALGVSLLEGAVRCAPLRPEPGELEKLDCSFGAWSIVLTGYDTPSRLADVREQAVAETPEAVRQAAATGPGAAFAMRESAGEPPRATVYWDADAPRPVSASISTTELSLPALVEFWDSRGAAGVPRPEVPGAAFDSATLWSLAAPFVLLTEATCGPIPANKAFPDAVDGVRCAYPNGVEVDFVQVPTAENVHEYRSAFASPDGDVPGTLRVGGWTDGTEPRGQLVEYVLAADGASYLYFDQPELRAFGLMFAPDRSQDDLKAFWADVRAG